MSTHFELKFLSNLHKSQSYRWKACLFRNRHNYTLKFFKILFVHCENMLFEMIFKRTSSQNEVKFCQSKRLQCLTVKLAVVIILFPLPHNELGFPLKLRQIFLFKLTFCITLSFFKITR